MFSVRLADLNIIIDNKYSYIEDMCASYLATFDKADFTVSVTSFEIRGEDDGTGYSESYLESLAIYRKIAEHILSFDGFLMHGVVADVDGKGVVFTAPSGVGKTTHTRLWKEYLGDRFTVVNGDKPLLRVIDGIVYAYGTPWAGKERIHINGRVAVNKICFIEQSPFNECIPLDKKTGLTKLLPQVYRPSNAMFYLKTVDLVSCLVSQADFHKIKCNMDITAAQTAYEGLKL